MSGVNEKLGEVFTCQMCGECCQGRGGIQVTDLDIDFLADFLKMPRAECIRQCLEDSPLGPAIKVSAEGCCLFNQNGRCQVHPVKPRICRDWPFLPAILLHPEELETAKTACPGIQPHCSHSDFLEWWRQKIS